MDLSNNELIFYLQEQAKQKGQTLPENLKLFDTSSTTEVLIGSIQPSEMEMQDASQPQKEGRTSLGRDG